MEFSNQNNTNFPQELKVFYKNLKYPKHDFLKYHQFVVQQYVMNNPKQRGLLIMHQTGTGKSILAASLSEMYRKLEPSRKIIVLVSKSLVSNFKKNIYDYIKNNEDIDPTNVIDKKYKFVSLNASNMFLQMTRIHKTTAEIVFEKNLGNIVDIIEKDDFLENSLLIVDEAHNLFNAISNGSKNAISLYDTILKTKNIKLLFLSGTPIINHPFELVPCFNMLKGLMYIDRLQKISTTLFPEIKSDFDNYFVNYKSYTMKNINRFQNRIVGLSSYYGEVYLGNKIREGFPEQYPIIVERVPMSPEQFAEYDAARDLEIEEAARGKITIRAERFSEKAGMTSTYRIRSRQISNFRIPEYALGTRIGKKSRTKFIDRIKVTDLKNLNLYSPKMKKILDNIKKYPKTNGVIYSEFVSGEGIEIFRRILDIEGYNQWNITGGFDEYDIEFLGGKTKTYAVITGETDILTRDAIIHEFNSDENKYGDKISLLLISKAGAEGLDLKNGRHIHIMEPFWNNARIEQVIARIVRYKSHESLSKKDKNVQPYIYLSDYPLEYDKKKITELTTDVELYKNAILNKKLIDDALHNVIEATIDCMAHYPTLDKKNKETLKCKLCSPTDQPLYHPILSKDFQLPDPCLVPDEKQIEVHEIILDQTGEKFYYSSEKKEEELPIITIYEYQKEIDGYTILPKNHPYYADLMRKILQF